MTLLVVVILVVMWALVLIPPFLRSRVEGRPSDSVRSFRRQLSTLGRTGRDGMMAIGGRAAPRRSAVPPSRSRYQAPRQVAVPAGRGAAYGYDARYEAAYDGYDDDGYDDGGYDARYEAGYDDGYRYESYATNRGYRPAPAAAAVRRSGPRPVAPRRSMAPAPSMSRAAARRRRQNVLLVLVGLCLATLLLGVGAAMPMMLAANVAVDVALVAYVALLVHLRRSETRYAYRYAWSHAA